MFTVSSVILSFFFILQNFILCYIYAHSLLVLADSSDLICRLLSCPSYLVLFQM